MRPLAAPWLALLACAAPASSIPAFELAAVSSSAAQVPAFLDGSDEPGEVVMAQICAQLAAGRAPAAVARALQLPQAELDARVAQLIDAGLLRREPGGAYTPLFPIIDRDDAARLRDLDRPMIAATVRAIEARAAEFRAAFATALQLDPARARALSLVLFGDVLFDRWQTRNLGNGFVVRATHAGKTFDLADVETGTGPLDALGIYNHREQQIGDVTVVTYGNARTLDPFAGVRPARVSALIASYVAFAAGIAPATPELTELARRGIIVVPRHLYAALPALTATFTDQLLALLIADRPKLEAAYRASRYAPAVSFDELGLWWYHLYDAAVVDQLIADGVIAVPAAGYATLLVTPD